VLHGYVFSGSQAETPSSTRVLTHVSVFLRGELQIRAEGIRMLSVLGTRTAADGGDVRPKRGCKSKLMHSPMKSEA
nr:hypothetical protein [Oscillatoriaceae cyanobacterium Prado104]